MTEIVRIYAGFDGTYNNMDNDIKIGDGSETNIAKLRQLYAEQGHIELYEEGSGTEPLTVYWSSINEVTLSRFFQFCHFLHRGNVTKRGM